MEIRAPQVRRAGEMRNFTNCRDLVDASETRAPRVRRIEEFHGENKNGTPTDDEEHGSDETVHAATLQTAQNRFQ